MQWVTRRTQNRELLVLKLTFYTQTPEQVTLTLVGQEANILLNFCNIEDITGKPSTQLKAPVLILNPTEKSPFAKCLTTRRRLIESSSLVCWTSLFYCLINQSEFEDASVCRGEQNGVLIAGVPFLLSPIPFPFFSYLLLFFLTLPHPRPSPPPLTSATCCTQANLRPKRLLRDFSTLSLAESRYANCALIVAGNFNCLCINSFKKHFRLKQIVKKPTRKNAILDIVLTNLHQYYDEPHSFPPLGLSDHNTFKVEARVRESGQNSTKFMLERDSRASRKAGLGRHLSAIDWPPLFSSLDCCADMLNVFYKVLRTRLDLLMPVNKVRVNTSDVPWMT